MASSLLAADKRWAAPTRKSGMTVLGKIPKPVNLPSQRLENLGLNPNVEIVPKGTHTWGSKPGPTTPNAWNSSSFLSSKKDGSSGVPSQFNDRPSSGSGSRPSTAGSESLDSSNAWGPNSRPSSASGTSPSPHLPVVTNRPPSAETRPGSSQLSRFADNPSENINVSIRTIDKSGSSSHGHGFTLSTGDFPTLGSEKSSESNSQRGHSSKGRPTSSSGKEGAQNDLGKSLTAGSGEAIPSHNNRPPDILKTDQNAHDGGASFPATGPRNESQQPQPYPPNHFMPPPPFDSWGAPPAHPVGGMWHRGSGPGGPYRQVGPRSSFPVEPLTYYSQFPPNSEAAARQGSGHGGYHPKNRDEYQAMPPNSYIMNQPIIPVRPVYQGIYQGPMPYDAYFAPQRPNSNNANVRDSPFVGAPPQSGILNQLTNQNDKLQPGHSQSRPSKHEVVPKEPMVSDRVHLVCRGQHRILHDNPDCLGGPGEVERKTQPAPPLLPHPDGNQSDANMRADTRDTCSERKIVLMKSVPDQRGPAPIRHSFVLENRHSHPRETNDNILRKKLKEDNGKFDQQPTIEKNVVLIEKIGILNKNARNIDVCSVAEPFSSKERKDNQQKNTDSKADRVIKDVSPTAASATTGQAASVSPISPVVQKLPNGGPLRSHFAGVSKAGNLSGSTHDRTGRRGDSSRSSHHGPAKDMPANSFTGGENSTTESLPEIQLKNSQHGQPPEQALQLPPVAITDDMPASPDYESQRARMRELAVQRAKQLQAEEEEWTKRQKAKALAKLDELNRRSSVHRKNSNDQLPEINDMHSNQKAGLDATTELATSTTESHVVAASSNRYTLHQPLNDKKDTAPVQSLALSTLPSAAGTAKGPASHITSSSSRNMESSMMEHIAPKSTSQSHDAGVPRRPTVSEVRIPGGMSSITVSTENVEKTVGASLDTSIVVATSHDAQNKKSARNSRSKIKVDAPPATSIYPPMVVTEQNTVSVSSEPKTQTAGIIISSSIVPTEGIVLTVGSITVSGISFGSFNQEHVKLPEEVYNTAKSRPRPQQAKRSGKNQHVVRPVEKPRGNGCIVGAPVKPSDKNEQSVETMLNRAVAVRTQPIGKEANDKENVARTNRAEMERYVPKPLSKELLQQSSEQNVPSENSCVENKSNGNEKSTGGKANAKSEPKKCEGKKTFRGHGKSRSWRRRNTDESALVVPNPAEQTDNCQESHEIQKPSDRHQQLEPVKQADYAARDTSGPNKTVGLPVIATKEHAAASRQKRQHAKAPQNGASNYSGENNDSEVKRDVNHRSTQGTNSNSSKYRNNPRSKVNSRAVAHWRPKSSHSQSNSQGNNTMDGQVDRVTLQDSSNSNLAQNGYRNNKKDASSNHGRDMTQGNDNQASERPANAEQQQFNHVARHQGQHSGRYHRGRGYDAGKPSHGANAERLRSNTHLEYQPVGSYNKPVDFQHIPSVDERSVVPPAPGPVYRELGQHRGPRHAGQFVNRNHASFPAANFYQDE